MATPQLELLEQLSRDKLFSIYQFLLLEAHPLDELSRSSSKPEMVNVLARVLEEEEAHYCVEFFENYEFYDVPGMKWEMLDSLPDELLGTLHTIYLDDFLVMEEHRELVNMLSQSPYFLKEDARKFYLWYHYFRKRITLEQLDDVSLSSFQPVTTQRFDLQGDRDAPLFTMESHGDILGSDSQDKTMDTSPVSLLGSEHTVANPAPKRTQTQKTATLGSPASVNVSGSLEKGSMDWKPLGISGGEVIGKQSVNRTIEITAFDLEEYIQEKEAELEGKKSEESVADSAKGDVGSLGEVGVELESASTHRSAEPTMVNNSFARVVEEMRKKEGYELGDTVNVKPESAAATPSESSDSPHVRATQEIAVPLDEGDIPVPGVEQATVVLDGVNLADALAPEGESGEAVFSSPSSLGQPPLTPMPPPSMGANTVLSSTEGEPEAVPETVDHAGEESVDDEPVALSDEDMLVDSVSLDSAEVEAVELDELDVADLDDDSDVVELEPLEEDDHLDESALVEDDSDEAEGEALHSLNWAETEILNEVPGLKPSGEGTPPPHPSASQEPRVKSSDQMNASATAAPPTAVPPTVQVPPSPQAAASAGSMPSGAMQMAQGAMVLPPEHLDNVTELLYRVSLLGAPYGRTQIRTIRLYMQRILGSNPAQLRRVRDKLKQLQGQDIQLIAPPLDKVGDWAEHLSYGMRLHLVHSSLFLLGVKTINTLDRFQDWLVDLTAELGISPGDVDLFGMFNIGREDIQLGVKDCLELFELELGATEAEIRKSHRNLAKRYHPDKFHSLGPEFRRMAEHKMKEANMALEILLHRADRNI